jgi:hypothetical protein
MQAPPGTQGLSYCDSTVYKLRALQKIKNKLLTTMASHIDKTITRQETIEILSSIGNSTCNVTTQIIDGVTVPGIVKFNRECSC